MDRISKPRVVQVLTCIDKLQHGIEFGYVGGDPAELMRICVENGMFTIAFLRESVTKVRLLWVPRFLF